jgi:sorbitol/mannitol transport system substrate-binding protein
MSYLRFRPRVLGAIGCAAAMVAVAACSGSSSSTGSTGSTGTVTVAVVSNPLITGQMIPLTKSNFEKKYPGINVKFATYTEADLRAAIEKDVSTHSNAFNVIMIGPYETPLFAKNGWLDNLSTQFIAKEPSYDAGDLLPPIAKALSYKGDLYAVPFYGESSMVYYRKDLFAKAGLTMPQHPTWTQIQSFAARLNQPGKVSGICLRGLAGWGDNMAALDTVVNTFGGEWFNEKWQPQLTSPAFEAATNFYVNLIRKYGEAGASNDSFNQLLTLYGQGKCAMWYDSTVAATSIATTYPSMASKTGYAFAPVGQDQSSGWLWTWSLGIPQGTSNQGAAWKFVSWATSKSVRLAGRQQVRLGCGPAGHQDLAVQQPAVPEGSQGVRGHHAGLDRLDGPGSPDPEPGALRRRPVRRHPSVRSPRRGGRPADRGCDRRHGDGGPGAEGKPGGRRRVHPGGTGRRKLARTRRGPGMDHRPTGAPVGTATS